MFHKLNVIVFKFKFSSHPVNEGVAFLFQSTGATKEKHSCKKKEKHEAQTWYFADIAYDHSTCNAT